MDRIDVWLARPDAMRAPSLLDRYQLLMSDDERTRAACFRFARDRHIYTITRALVRTTLSRYAPVHPSAWVFTADPHGRPQIAVSHPLANRIVFNVSHTAGLIALAIRWDLAVGVDVENVRERQTALEVVDTFFSVEERRALAGLPPASLHDRFFEYWTLKESYVKARGRGLSLPLDRFTIAFPDEETISLSCSPLFDDDASRWCLWQFRFGNAHLVAVCAERDRDRTPQVSITQVVPLECESRLNLNPLRSSSRADLQRNSRP